MIGRKTAGGYDSGCPKNECCKHIGEGKGQENDDGSVLRFDPKHPSRSLKGHKHKRLILRWPIIAMLGIRAILPHAAGTEQNAAQSCLTAHLFIQLHGDEATAKAREMVEEMRRGIWETTGLYAEPTGDGWLAVTCDSRAMAAWLCATIILENVEARVEEDRLLVPAEPRYRLEDEVKSIITVLAKTNHYWQAHVTG